MEKIRIKSLGPVSNFEMEIKKYNLFIGEQATGKSTISKAIYYFRTIKDIVISYFYQISLKGAKGHWDDLEDSLESELQDYFQDIFDYIDNADIVYEYSAEIKTAVKMDSEWIESGFSSRMQEFMCRIEAECIQFHQELRKKDKTIEFLAEEKQRWYEEIEMRVNGLFGDSKKNYYIPAGRSMMSLMAKQKTYLNYGNMDIINRRFMQLIEGMQDNFDQGIKKAVSHFKGSEKKAEYENVADTIIEGLKGEYFFNSGKETILLQKSNKSIPIDYASSGQQEVLWLFNFLYILMLRKKESFVIIEEPEAHLYPKLQKQVIDFITEFLNLTNSSVLITTHSPYTLTCINNLFYAGSLYQKTKHEGIQKFMGNKMIFPGELQALKLSLAEDATYYEDIIDHDLMELKTELIDEVTDYISSEYTKLFYMGETDENK